LADPTCTRSFIAGSVGDRRGEIASAKPLEDTMTETPPDTRVEFAAYLERLRTISGLTVPEMAIRSQLDVVELEEILRAEAKLPLDVILLLARGLAIEPGAFIDGFPGLPEVG
jgi:hypothetical protein